MYEEIVIIGVFPYPPTQFEQFRRVYGAGGICPTVQSIRGGAELKVLEVYCVGD